MSRMLLLLLLFCFSRQLSAQDTLKFMHYNLMYYGKETDFCNESNNSIDNKNHYLKKIIQYENPDVFSVNEMDGNDSYPVTEDEIYLLNYALNTGSNNHYRSVPFEETYLANTLFYNKRKLGLYSYSKIRMFVGYFEKVFQAYRFYYKSKELYETSDTAFFTCFVVHLKAGEDYSDVQERKDETDVLMDYIVDNLEPGENYFIMGDLNVYYPNEPGFLNLTEPVNEAYRFYDPADAIGEWHSNSDFAQYHTQSTHTSGSCFSGGGMDDRFDFILASEAIMDTGNELSYLEGSYRTPGQDGQRFNMSLNRTNNGSVPDSIAEALYQVSDHLPVSMKLVVQQNPAQILQPDTLFWQPDPVTPALDSFQVFFDYTDTEKVVDNPEILWSFNDEPFASSRQMILDGNHFTASVPLEEDTQNGKLKVVMHDKQGNVIGESPAKEFIVDQAAGSVHISSSSQGIKVTNPVNEELVIWIDKPYSEIRIQVGNMNGMVLTEKVVQHVNEQQIKIPVGDYKSGMYWVKIWSYDQLVKTQKIILVN